jgi:transmembrane sensor
MRIAATKRSGKVNRAAAEWVARFHGDERGPDDEAEFQRWLAEDPSHREAFDRATAIWSSAGGADPVAIAYRRRMYVAQRRRFAAAAAAVFFIAVGGAAAWKAIDRTDELTYATAFGEIRRVTLPDNSIVVLDSRTVVKGSLSRLRRNLVLVSGRAHFEVAPDPMRPFVVEAGPEQVVALGTVFEVAKDPEKLSVTLFEGHVQVSSARAATGPRKDVLAPGERLSVSSSGDVAKERPNLEEAGAWQTGTAIFDDTPLSDAIAEINRYARRRIRLEDPDIANWRVSGIYQTRDVDTFARNLAILLPLQVVYHDNEIIFRKAK